MAQYSVRCSVYRGGTSRGLFFHEKDLPKDIEKQKAIFTHGIDSYNLSQINGLGSGTSHSSKVVVVGRDNNRITYTFYQIGIGVNIVDDKGTCGNLMAAVGAFAVNERMIHVNPNDKSVDVLVFNTNIKQEIMITVPVEKGMAKVNGNYFMPGIVEPGAKYKVNLLNPGGSKTGKTLPLGSETSIEVNKEYYPISFVDVVNPFVFVNASSLGLIGTEKVSEISQNKQLMKQLNDIRDEAAVCIGFAKDRREARTLSSAIPKIAIVSQPKDYETTSRKRVNKDEIDILAKMISMGKVHRTFAGSGLYNLAVATLLQGTIPNDVTNLTYEGVGQTVRIGHPDGIAVVRVTLTQNKTDVKSVGLDRTARHIMKGELYIPNNM